MPARRREGLTLYLRSVLSTITRIRHSNIIEGTFGETGQRTKVIGRLPRVLLPHPTDLRLQASFHRLFASVKPAIGDLARLA